MKNQPGLFETKRIETEVVAVLGQLPSNQKEMAMQLLAELMARRLTPGASEEGEGGGEAEAHE